jgi:hypothetical protein
MRRLNWLFITVLVALCATLTAHAQTRCPGGAVNIFPTSDWVSILQANPAGTVYCVQTGTYSGWSVSPEDGDQFYSASLHGAVLNGNNNTLSAFWGKSGVGDNLADTFNVRVDGFRIINYYNANIWQGGTPNIGALDAQTGWIIAYNLIENNTAAVVFARANWGCSYNVEMFGNTIQNNTHVAILGNMVDGEVYQNTIYNNGWGGLTRLTPEGRADDDNTIEWNGQFKITRNRVGGWSGAPVNYVCDNIPTAVTNVYPLPATRSAHVFNNTIEGNRWAGYWNDVEVKDSLVEGNRIVGNSGPGIFHEISYGALFRGNTLVCNGYDYMGGGGWSTGDFFGVSSEGMTFENNYVRVCGLNDSFTVGSTTRTWTNGNGGRGIVIFEEARHTNTTATVRNNIVVVNANAQFASAFYRENGGTATATFTNNDYYVTATGRSIFRYLPAPNDGNGVSTTYGTWQSRGYDTSGGGSIETTSTPPSGTSPVNTPTPGGPTATTAPTNTAVPTQPSSGPYGGTAAVIPGRIEAENFDYGANGVAYFDTGAGNQFTGFIYRNTDVDIKTDPAGGYAIGYGVAGEYLVYTVNVETHGVYTITVSANSADSSGTLPKTIRLQWDGEPLTTVLTVPQQQQWDVYSNIAVNNVTLNTGTHNLRLEIINGFVDVTWIDFTLVSGVTNTPTNTPTLTPTHTPTNTPVASPTPTATQTPTTAPTSVATLTPTSLPVPSATPNLNQQQSQATLDASNLLANDVQATLSALEAQQEALFNEIEEARQALLNAYATVEAAEIIRQNLP